MIGLICPELGVAPLVDPGTDLEDERLTPVGSPSPVVDKSVPLSASSGVDLELACVFLEVGVLTAIVTPIVDPELGSSMTPAEYPVPPIPELSAVDSVPLEVASPARPAGGSPARNESLLCQVSPPGSVAQTVPSPTSPVLRSTPDVSPPSGLAAMDQYLPWSASLPVGETAESPLLPAPLTPRRMVEGQFVPGSVVTSPTGETDVAGATRECRTCLGRAPLTFIRTVRLLVPLHECWMVCGVASTALHLTMRRMVVRTSVLHMVFSYTIHGCWNMWVRRSRLDYSAVVRSTGSISWDMRRRLRPRSSFNTTRTSSCRTCRCESGAVSGGCDAAGGAVVPCSSGGALHGGHGIVAATNTQGIRGPLPSATCNTCMSCSDCFPDLPQ